jgi:hypothetical protein
MGILGIGELGKKKIPAPGIQLFPYSTTRTLQITGNEEESQENYTGFSTARVVS